MAKTKFKQTSIGRKVLMALSGLFLMLFLLQHLTINMLSVISPDTFNEVSHFMGTNPVVQFLLQPILIAAIIFHFIMGIVLELKNNSARNIKYAYNKPSTNSSWMSRNMIVTGLTVLAFLGLHFYDFWIQEINVKFIQGDMTGLNADGELRYYEELHHKFVDAWRVVLYVVSFVLLALHLQHGFASAFQSIGARTGKNKTTLQKFGNIFAVVVPLGFVFIAVFHFLTQSH